MKIIKEGIKPERTMRVTCLFCKAELEVGANDLEEPSDDAPNTAAFFSFSCPCCGGINEIDLDDLPKGFLQ